jgi:CheY-like chemotaxis protein
VDDVSVVRLTTGRVLSEAGYRVIEAASAAEAIERRAVLVRERLDQR